MANQTVGAINMDGKEGVGHVAIIVIAVVLILTVVIGVVSTV
jgi:hypothetical protein